MGTSLQVLATDNGVGFDLPYITGPQLFAVVTVIGVVVAIWVYIDASRRNVSNPGIWAVAIGFLFLLYGLPGVVALVVYLAIRSDQAGETEALNSESGEDSTNR